MVFFAYHTSELLEINYLDEHHQWLKNAEERLTHFFRSRGDDSKMKIDRRLVELADYLQDHCEVDTIEVISAYRSPAFNQSLKQSGHHVANESFHTLGLAMDVHIDELDEGEVRDILLEKKLGGVGFYGRQLMVHMDFGPVRTWQDGEFFENTEVGEFNSEQIAKIRTQKFYYRLGETVKFSVNGLTEKFSSACLEKFSRGQWQNVECNFFSIPDLAKLHEQGIQLKLEASLLQKAPQSLFGKFRLVLKNQNRLLQNSNEFYVKRRCAAGSL